MSENLEHPAVATGLEKISFHSNPKEKKETETAQLCLALCNPMVCSPLGSFVHGILQARMLEWAAISFSRVSSWTRDQNANIHWIIEKTREFIDYAKAFDCVDHNKL